MKFVKHLLVSAVLLGSAVGAQAADYNLGTLSAGYTGFGPNSVISGSFVDKINFNLSGLSNESFGAGALNFTLGGLPFLNINNLSMSLFDSNDTLQSSGLDFTVNSLTSGNYYLKVTGTATGFAGGLYAGGINTVNVTPVPEPDALSLMLSGLAMLGFMAYRRRQV
ncbi:MAG: FxDxF family PEP-CTERM protein [Methylophilaceae bacterium]